MLQIFSHACVVNVNLTRSLFYCIYEGHSISSRTVLLSKHTVTAENPYYYEVVLPLLYITYHGLIYEM